EKFHAAKSAAAQRIHATGPSLSRALKRIFYIAGERFAISCARFCHGYPRETDAGRSVTPLTRPGRSLFCPEIRPVCSARIVARIFKCNAFRGGLREIFAPACCSQRSKCMGKTGGAMRHAVQRLFARALTDPAAATFRAKPGL